MYDFFISYKRDPFNSSAASTLLDQIEKFSTPGKTPEVKAIRLRAFRDVDELHASSNLGAAIHKALENSRFLIVICSPESKASHWVGEEIKIFKRLGRQVNILPILIKGDPSESFHEELITSDPLDSQPAKIPLACDVRSYPFEERKVLKNIKGSHEILRLIAPALGCTFDDLRQRDNLRRIAALRRNLLLTSLFVLLFLCLSLYSYRQSRIAEEQEKIALTKEAEAVRRVRDITALNLATKSSKIAAETEGYFYWSKSGGARDKLQAPDFSEALRLARQSVLETLKKDGYVLLEAFAALHAALSAAPPLVGKIAIENNTEQVVRPLSIKWSHDGKYLAFYLDNGRLEVWNAVSGGLEYSMLYEHGARESDPVPRFDWCGPTRIVIGGPELNPKILDIRQHQVLIPAEITVKGYPSCGSSGKHLLMLDGKHASLIDFSSRTYANV